MRRDVPKPHGGFRGAPGLAAAHVIMHGGRLCCCGGLLLVHASTEHHTGGQLQWRSHRWSCGVVKRGDDEVLVHVHVSCGVVHEPVWPRLPDTSELSPPCRCCCSAGEAGSRGARVRQQLSAQADHPPLLGIAKAPPPPPVSSHTGIGPRSAV